MSEQLVDIQSVAKDQAGARPSSGGQGALHGVRVVDLSRVLAGPFCAQILADHGADVIKVEAPEGDETRGWGPPFHDESSSYYTGLNRNKRDIALDMATERGRDVLKRLLRDADVVVENFKPGTLERWGVSYDEVLSVANPRLIHCRVAAYGSGGPMSAYPGYDGMVQAWAGLMSINGMPDGGPLRVGVPIVDFVTAHNAAIGILLALNDRTRTGLGQSIEVSLFDSALSILHPHAPGWFDCGETPKPSGNNHPTVVPYGMFQTKTGPITVGAANDRQFKKLCTLLGEPGLAERPEFLGNKDRSANRVQLLEILSEKLAQVDGPAFALQMMDAGLGAGAVLSVGEALQLPQARERDVVAQVGAYRGVAPPVRMSRTRAAVRTAPPKFAEHTKSILAEHGYGDKAIEELIESGVTPVTPRGR
jgi:crotonobetainyl-CoA:carnitine CoA-transferase CaiB-like acyl-CoA transferase